VIHKSFFPPSPSDETHGIESQSNTNLNNMSYSILLDSSLEEETMPPTNKNDQLLLQCLMEPVEHHLEGPDFLQLPGMNDSISSMTSQKIGIDKDYQASKDDVVATMMNGGNSLVPSPEDDNDAVASSRLFEDGIASLEGYLDDMIFGEDSSINNTMEEVINNLLFPDYVVCLEAKEWLQMLSENELPPVIKSQIGKLHPVEEELVIILRKNNLPISLYKELIDLA
jgi:hypothetical protein